MQEWGRSVVSFTNLSNERKLKYLSKIHHARDRIRLINEWITEDNPDDKTVLAIMMAFHEAIEVSTDLVAMALKDHKIPPRDDYRNIEELARIEMISKQLAAVLIECNSLRNRLVHLYNGSDTPLLFSSINRLIPEVSHFLEVIETWIRQK